MRSDYKIVATWVEDHGPGFPYKPSFRTHFLLKFAKPGVCGNSFATSLNTAVSVTWVTDDTAARILERCQALKDNS